MIFSNITNRFMLVEEYFYNLDFKIFK